MVEIKLDRINVNDDEHVILSLLVSDGAVVAKGTPIAEIETSKATVELEALEGGPIKFLVSPGQLVKVGAPLCLIGEGAAEASSNVDSDGSTDPVASDVSVSCGSNSSSAGKGDREEKGFFTSRPYRQFTDVPLPLKEQNREKTARRNVDKRKAFEIASLSIVNPSGLVSCLVRRLELSVRSHKPGGIFSSNISDLIVYECAKLIGKYPKLNARYDDVEGCVLADGIRFGYSIDVDDDLAVYNLGDCSSMVLDEVRNAIEGCVEAHVTKKITKDLLQETTITLTDLSGSGIDSFFPLINGSQSCILGYASPSEDIACLCFAFDHRVMGGKYAADFLDELASRVGSHFSGMHPSGLSCDFCGKDGQSLREFREKGLLRVVTPDGDEVNCCRVCFENW